MRFAWMLMAISLVSAGGAGCSSADEGTLTLNPVKTPGPRSGGGEPDSGAVDAGRRMDPPASATPDGSASVEDGGISQILDASRAVDAGPSDAAPALVECTGSPSLDRLQKWFATAEGTMVPASGSILVPEAGRQVAKVQFVNSEWHVVPVWIANKFDLGEVDLTASAGFTLTYSATDDLYVQIRPASHWSGGDKYLTKIPSTGGQVQTKVFPFAIESWTTLPELGVPTYSFAESLKDVRGLVFVGKTANTIAIHGLRFDGYVPTCL